MVALVSGRGGCPTTRMLQILKYPEVYYLSGNFQKIRITSHSRQQQTQVTHFERSQLRPAKLR